MTKNQLYKKRFLKAKFFSKIIAAIPYVRTVILTGSLAEGKVSQGSDIDILIIAQAGRIFSARFFVNAFGTLCHIKRSKDERKSHNGKFCFNYFISENYLKLPTCRGEQIDRYCAKNYSQAKLLAGSKALYSKFLFANKKLFERYGCPAPVEKSIPDDSKVLTSRFERWAKKYQIKKIKSDTRTNKYPSLIVFNDDELRFHPPKS